MPLTAALSGSSLDEFSLFNPRAVTVLFWSFEKPIGLFTALGLNKLNSSNELPDNQAVRGMIFKIKHLVRVEEI